ncbi:putative phenylacetyl-CoA ligase [Aspergillus pseudocaelatus]|uniref:Phenylacetyl-CoA ligase n=1 Tax=Aspergillus pseudocaelatus TaxID=1825620 RepID=A0ABQ6WXY4_9EURO|nr:putative phenylacetyl-CoA ligase [Aspergillus pseudocaelatus]
MTQSPATPAVPPTGIWEFFFERPSLPFSQDHVIFRSATTDSQYTYRQVQHRAGQFGRALQAQWGWCKGDILMVMAPNDIDTPPVIWGCHSRGGIVAPVNPELSARELRHQLEGSRVRGLIVHPQCAATAVEAAHLAKFPIDRILLLRFDTSLRTYQSIPTVEQFVAEVERASNVELQRVKIEQDKDIAFLIYSSGTTGRPKGVMVSHRNVLAAVMFQAAVDGPHVNWRRDRTLAVLPTYHIFGLICLVHLPIYLGTTTFYMDKFDLATFCNLIQEHRISHAYVAPPIVLHLAKNNLVSDYDLRSIRMITSGGAPLAANLITELHQQRQIPVRQAYGLSETTSISHVQPWDKWMDGMGSNGPPISGVEAKFITPDGHAVTRGHEGELCVRGPTVFKGYRDEPDLTAACMTPDGWFKTGDLGYEDERGNMFITDRLKDLIKFKGYQVAPAELEDLLLEHNAVRDAAVIGVMNHDLASEVPLAYIVVKAGQPENEATAQLILDHIKDRTVSYKHIRGGIVFSKEIPKSPSGKILKRKLLEDAVSKGVRPIGAVKYSKYSRTAKI